MTVLVNSFEGGTSGTTITTGNSGGASGNAFDSVTTGTLATTEFDNTHAAHGNLSCNLTTSVTSASSYVTWSTSLGTNATVWFRVYLYVTSYSSSLRFLSALSSGSNAASLRMTSGGLLIFENGAFVGQHTFVNPIPLNQWCRIEGYVTGNSTTGAINATLYQSADSVVPTETFTTPSTVNTTGTITQVNFGVVTNAASIGPFWIDDIGASTTGYLGPSNTSIIYPQRGPSQAKLQTLPQTPQFTAIGGAYGSLTGPGGDISFGNGRVQWSSGSLPPLLLQNSFDGGLITTVAAGSNGGEISTIASWANPSPGVLDVALTSGSPGAGTLLVATTSGTAVITYSGTSGGNSYTNCAYVSGSATGTVATGGTVQIPVSAANSGGASGHAFDLVNIAAGSYAVYSNTTYASGSLSSEFATVASAGNYVSWQVFGIQPKLWFRICCFFTANPSSTNILFLALSSSVQIGGIGVNTSGKLVTINSSSSTVTTSTNTIPLNQWFRIEGFIYGSPNQGQLSVSLFATPSAQVPIEIDTSTAVQSTYGPVQRIRFGVASSAANAGPFYLDSIGISNTGPLGPVSFAEPNPLVTPVRAFNGVQLPPRGRVGSSAGSLVPVLLTNSFEGGTNGTTISSSNSGGASGSEFTVVIVGSGATNSFSTAEYAHGSLSAEFATGGSAAQPSVGWSNYPTTSSQGFFVSQLKLWFRFYAYLTANPSTQFRIFQTTSNNSASRSSGISVTTSGTLIFTNGTGGTVITTTRTVPLNQWFRVEGFVFGSVNQGQVSLSLFSPDDSQIPVETHISGITNTLGPLNIAQFGVPGTSVANVTQFWIDDLGISNTGPLGPASFPGPASSGHPARSIIPGRVIGGGGVIEAQHHTPPYVPPIPPPPVTSAPPVDSSVLPSISTTW